MCESLMRRSPLGLGRIVDNIASRVLVLHACACNVEHVTCDMSLFGGGVLFERTASPVNEGARFIQSDVRKGPSCSQRF